MPQRTSINASRVDNTCTSTYTSAAIVQSIIEFILHGHVRELDNIYSLSTITITAATIFIQNPLSGLCMTFGYCVLVAALSAFYMSWIISRHFLNFDCTAEHIARWGNRAKSLSSSPYRNLPRILSAPHYWIMLSMIFLIAMFSTSFIPADGKISLVLSRDLVPSLALLSCAHIVLVVLTLKYLGNVADVKPTTAHSAA
ncbi:hypothetical protein ABKN59_003441 [Abortiporus biennis]